ncbi:MAG: hypothetical protein JST81_12470 [Bacteroidetes bacterium]|jgi:hypothetical protein|nr:hypothetical protein [Bacteroidota bacterium]
MRLITMRINMFGYFCFVFKKAFATILLLAFVVQTFSAPFIRLDYFFNQADYAKNCVNKARPQMHCNGKCQVMKKIIAEEKKQQEQDEQKAGSKVEVLSSKSFFISSVTVFSYPIQRTYILRNDFSLSSTPRSVFHPPTV